MAAVEAAHIQSGVRAAIERSRRARRAFERHRRRVAISAVICAAAMFPLSLAVMGVTGSDVVHAAANEAKSLSDLLGQRSPGARTEAKLTKIKKSKRALARVSHSVPSAPDATELA